MIYDSQEQKNFISKLLLAYNCSYAECLAINKTHALAIQNGVVIPVEDQQKLIDEQNRQENTHTVKTEE